MAGQRPYEPNDPPRQPRFQLPKETDAMPDAPTSKSPQPTHEQLRQQQNQAPQQPSQSGGNIQNILAYFASQGVADDHVVATIGGFPLKLSELKQSHPQPQPSPPKTEPNSKSQHEERKRPSKGEENDS